MPVDWDKFGEGKRKPKVDWSKFGGTAKKSGGGFFGAGLVMGALNVLDRPGQAVKGLIKDARENAGTGATISHLGKALTGHSHLSTQEAVGRHDKGLLGGVENFVGDVVLDPTTYLSFGTTAAAKQGLKATGEHLGEAAVKRVAEKGTKALTAAERAKVAAHVTPKVMRKLDAGAKGGVKFAGHTLPGLGSKAAGVSKVIDAGSATRKAFLGTKVGEGLVPRAAIEVKRGREVADTIGALGSSAEAAAANASAAVEKRLLTAAKAARVTTDELHNVVLPAIDIGGHSVTVPKRLQPLVDELAAIGDETTRKQVAADVLQNAREDYVPRFPTPEAKEALGGDVAQYSVGRSASSVARQGGHLKGRTNLADSPLLDADARLRSTLGLKGPAYETDPIVITAKRAALADRAVAQRQMFDKLATLKDDAGHALFQEASPGTPKPPGWETIDAGPIGTFHAPRDIAKEVNRVRAVVTNDDSIKEFSGFIRKLNTLWKAQATMPLVGGGGFFERNAQGNFFNNFLAGVKNPIDYARALRLQRGKNLTAADRHLLDLAKEHGVLDDGFFMHDLMDPAARGGRLGRVAVDAKAERIKTAINPASTESLLIRPGRAVNSAIENNARLAHFIAKMRELGDAEAAARSVKKYLFDYGDLTAVERDKIKAVIPFYTWMRKNTPLQFAEAARQPGKYTALSHIFNEASQGRDMEGVPSFLRDEPYLPFNVGGQTIAIRPDLPPEAALESVDPSKQADLGMFGGPGMSLLKAVVEDRTGKSLFTGFNVKGSRPQRFSEALLPVTGKLRRAPYGPHLPGLGIGLNTDNPDQYRARLINALLGLRAYRADTTKEK